MASNCKSCGLVHAEYSAQSGTPCQVVRRLAAARGVANAPGVANNAPQVANARGDRHRKTEARAAYMRDYMRRRRAAKKG